MHRFIVPFALLVTVVLALANTTTALADWSDSNSTSVGPISSGSQTGQGSAQFDPSGVQANAFNQGAPPAGSTTTSGFSCPPGKDAVAAYSPTDGTYEGMTCLATGTGPGVLQLTAPTATPLDLAQEASSRQPWPSLSIGVNPGNGLTGLPSWFWVVGNPTMPDTTATAGTLTVTVRATLTDVLWDFGDGSTTDSGLGLGSADPVPGTGIHHVYETDSRSRPAGLPLVVRAVYHVTYSANGGPWTDLGTKANAYTRSYVVNQLEPQAVGS